MAGELEYLDMGGDWRSVDALSTAAPRYKYRRRPKAITAWALWASDGTMMVCKDLEGFNSDVRCKAVLLVEEVPMFRRIEKKNKAITEALRVIGLNQNVVCQSAIEKLKEALEA